MNREEAKNLVIQTFENKFDKENFIRFIANLFKKYDRSKALDPRIGVQGITEKYLDFISSWERIGRYEDSEGNIIDILIVKLKKEISLLRARSAQRNFVADYLRGKSGTTSLKDAALVAFISPNEEDWRFSLVKMDYKFEETETGRVKIKEEFTPAKRWSFLVGPNEKSHTAQSRFIPLLEKKEPPLLHELEEAFNIEVVTEEFFRKYRDLFIKTKIELDIIVQKDKRVKDEFQRKNITTIDFAKKLLGQIVFLYFLQKKGWFGVEKGKPWGTGPKDFIRKLFNKEYGDYQNFYNDILEPLLYEALRTDRSADDHYYSRFNCKIPFLNGGLFDPPNNFDWVNIDLLLPNELFSNFNKTPEGDVGDGILDIFDRYNFTVNEEEPLEKEVALDPELLGKIYEKLNAIREDNFDEYMQVLKSGKKGDETKFNKEYGVYYTPREIVHYMCQESLISYLETELNGKVKREDIERFVNLADNFLEHEKIAVQKNEKIKNGEQKETKYEHKIPKSIIENAKEIDNLLANIKVCDPAVGSGAFLVGMLHEIVKLRQLLSVYLGNEVSIYDLKRQTIENSLYGVDIDPGAVEICKLRLWLSLVVDEDDFHNIKPLPNLDYKVVYGNSLFGLPQNVLLNEQINKEIEHKKKILFSTTSPNEKNKIKNEIEKLFKKQIDFIKSMHPQIGEINFDFRIYFSEIFNEEKENRLKGFNIIIANPPYVRQERIKNLKLQLKNYFSEIYDSRADIFTYFYKKSYEILQENGILCFISSNKWMRAKYGEKLRKFLRENTTILKLIDFSGYRVFEQTVDTCILVFRKERPPKGHIFEFLIVPSDVEDLESYLRKRSKYLIEQETETVLKKVEYWGDVKIWQDFRDWQTAYVGNWQTILQEKLSDNGWTLGDEKTLALKEKIEKVGKPLKKWDVKIYFGIKTGYNEAFIIDTKTRNKILANCRDEEERKRTEEIIKPVLRGRDIERYRYKWAGLWIILAKFGFYKVAYLYPAVVEHLSRYEENLKNRGQCIYTRSGENKLNKDYPGQHHWLELDNNPTDEYLKEFGKEKIVWQEIVREPSFAYDDTGIYVEATAFLMTGKNLKYLLGLLNSKPVAFFFKTFYAGGGLGSEGYRYKKAFLEQLPIPPITEKNQPIADQIVQKVDQILSIKQQDPDADTSNLEKGIDQLVYELYNLTEEEIKIVEGFLQ